MTMEKHRRLVLIDIDGTLLTPGLTPRRALRQAIRELTGQEIEFRIEQLAGLTDPLIVQNALVQLGIDRQPQDGLIGHILNRYLALLEQEYPLADDHHLFPDALVLLNYLARMPVRLGLITGNMQRGAQVKLAPYRLDSFFTFGVFGDEAADRNALPPLALQKVKCQFEEEFHPAEVLIIGDTERDAAAARVNNMRSVIVIRRSEWRDLILAEQPDLIVESFDPIMEFQEWFEELFLADSR